MVPTPISARSVPAAGHLITQIHSIVSRDINPLDNAVISVNKIHGGTWSTIIPDEVEIVGTVRSPRPQVREDLKSRLEQVTQGVARSFAVDCNFEYRYGYPPLINDPLMSRLAASVCAQGIGEENVEYSRPAMGSEIFAYYLQKVPGSFFRLGCRNEKRGIIHPLHSSLFDIDEEVRSLGVEMFVRIIERYLGLQL